MNEQLNKLLEKNIENGPQSRFLNQAFEIMMNYNNSLLPYVSDFQIHYHYEQCIGSYNNEKRVLSINIMNLYDKWFEPRMRNRKLLALQVLRHELEHARQLKILYEQHQGLESKIVQASLRSYALKNGLVEYKKNSNNDIENINYLKNENYYLDPCERLAEIKAWKFLIKLLKNSHNSNDLIIANDLLKSVYENGYRDKIELCPTYQFLLNLQLFDDLDSIMMLTNSNKYNYNSRITYGLPISSEEMKKYQKK